MGEITRNNFDEKYPEIVDNLRSAVFIAVDTEFTGLLSDPKFKPSLFDTGNERYEKLRQSIGQFLIMEVGITAFRCIQNKNKYEANRYTFYVFPRSFAFIDNTFMCQASSLEFLCQHNFDFNKFVYGGIPYLNRQHEAHLHKELSEGSLFHHLECSISLDDEKSIQLVCSRVAEWAASAVLGDTINLDDLVVCNAEKWMVYFMHKELRQRLPNIWTFPDSGLIRVEKISQMERKALEESKDRDGSLEAGMINSLLGFSRLFKLLVELRKPIVGHNLLLDLMIMYNQFHEPLPAQLSDFKEKIHRLFPVIYDTKFLSFEMKKIIKKEDMWDSNALSHLYHFFKEGRGRYIVLCSPSIELQDGAEVHDLQGKVQQARADVPEQSHDLDVKFHEAGWDSFCAGYCFIRMAHLFAHVTVGGILDGRALTSRELLSGVVSKKNCVNVVRANVSHVCLDGPDPPSDRPKWLHVQAKGFRAIDISKVAKLFSRFSTVDVKPFTRYRALVAVGNHGSAKDIVRQFQKHKDFHVSRYHPVRHSPVVRAFLWTGIVVSGGICAYLLYK